jgi:hypothetical protein
MMDLRLVSATLKGAAVSEVQRRLFPWQMAGLAVMGVSGVLLSWSDPVRFYENIFFRIKVILLLLAAVNALVFHFTVYRRVDDWDEQPLTPLGVRLAGAFSLFLWAGVVVTGRMVAYNWFN